MSQPTEEGGKGGIVAAMGGSGEVIAPVSQIAARQVNDKRDQIRILIEKVADLKGDLALMKASMLEDLKTGFDVLKQEIDDLLGAEMQEMFISQVVRDELMKALNEEKEESGDLALMKASMLEDLKTGFDVLKQEISDLLGAETQEMFISQVVRDELRKALNEKKEESGDRDWMTKWTKWSKWSKWVMWGVGVGAVLGGGFYLANKAEEKGAALRDGMRVEYEEFKGQVTSTLDEVKTTMGKAGDGARIEESAHRVASKAVKEMMDLLARVIEENRPSSTDVSKQVAVGAAVLGLVVFAGKASGTALGPAIRCAFARRFGA